MILGRKGDEGEKGVIRRIFTFQRKQQRLRELHHMPPLQLQPVGLTFCLQGCD